MFFLPLPFLLIELLAATTFVHFFGFWDVFLAYVAPCFLGAVLFSMTGRSMIHSLQGGLVQGQLPGDRVLHRTAVLLGSILLMIPTFLSRVLALFLILPLLRHLSVFVFKTYIFKRLAKSPFTFIRTGGPGPRGPFGFERESPPQERDVEVVDVTPIEITHTKKEKE